MVCHERRTTGVTPPGSGERGAVPRSFCLLRLGNRDNPIYATINIQVVTPSGVLFRLPCGLLRRRLTGRIGRIGQPPVLVVHIDIERRINIIRHVALAAPAYLPIAAHGKRLRLLRTIPLEGMRHLPVFLRRRRRRRCVGCCGLLCRGRLCLACLRGGRCGRRTTTARANPIADHAGEERQRQQPENGQ